MSKLPLTGKTAQSFVNQILSATGADGAIVILFDNSIGAKAALVIPVGAEAPTAATLREVADGLESGKGKPFRLGGANDAH